MWTWTLNWGEVREDLLIGSCPVTLADLDHVREATRASALLSVQTDECRARFDVAHDAQRRHGERCGLVMVNTPMRDFDAADQRRKLPQAVAALTRLLADGHRVYVHCTAGINRSPLTVLAYLSFVESHPVDQALALIRRGRPQAEPYWDAYLGCRQDLVERYRNAISHRALRLFQQHPGRPADINWYEAERRVIRDAFATHPGSIELRR
jgi:predicted protein tyrosine phosphatase